MSAEVKRSYSGHIDFSALTREYAVPLGILDLRSIVDIDLQLFFVPSCQPLTPSQQFIGGEDFRLYLNEYNVTSCLKEELKLLIRVVPKEQSKTLYLKGVDAYLRFIRSFAGMDELVKNDWDVAKQYAETDDWGTKFDTLGDRNVGWSGNLHVFSFVYRVIPIAPVSLASVWKRYREAVGGNLPESLSQFTSLTIRLSEGPAPSFEEVKPATVTPGGRLYFQVEPSYTNPLEPKLKEIASRLLKLSKELEYIRSNYLDALASELQVLHNDFANHTQATKTALDRLRATVDNIAGPP